MVTIPKRSPGSLWPHGTKDPKHDPDTEQLRRDRITALIVVGIMLLLFAVIAVLSALSGGPTGSEMIDPWIMP